MALLEASFFSNSLQRIVTIKALIPIENKHLGAGDARPAFPTLYLLHGLYGTNMDWLLNTRISRLAEEYGLAVILPSGENHFYVDCQATGEAYGAFIGRELPQVCRQLFPLSAQREQCFIGGLSMGGYGALRNGLKYSDTFGKVLALSSLIDPNDTLALRPASTGHKRRMDTVFGGLDKVAGSDKDCRTLSLQAQKKNRLPAMYIACGLGDELLPFNRTFRDFLEKQGIAHHYEEGPGGHDWDYWDEQIRLGMAWLMAKPKRVKG